MLKSRVRVASVAVALSMLLSANAMSASASTRSATSLLNSALRDAVAGHAVHEVTRTISGGQTMTMVNDIASSEGRQIISFSSGASAEVIAFDSRHKAFTKGNEIGLENYFGFPSSEASTYAGKWMETVPADKAWSNITGSTTLATDFDTILRIHNPVLSPILVTINGVRAYEITGTHPASANGPTALVTLDISDATVVLPLRFTVIGQGAAVTANWSKWGEALALREPTNSMPLP